MVESGNIEDAIQRIKAARRIMIFARGFSELIAQEMMVKFQLTGKYCEMHTDPNIIKNISRKLSKDDIVIFVSLNGETKELTTAAENCYKAEIGTILLTLLALNQKAPSSQIMRYAPDFHFLYWLESYLTPMHCEHQDSHSTNSISVRLYLKYICVN